MKETEEDHVDADDAPEEEFEPEQWPAPIGWAIVLGVALFNAGAMVFALAPERRSTKVLFVTLGLLYGAGSALALLRLKRAGELHLAKPRSGDLTFGGLVAFVLFGLTFAFHALFTSAPSPRHGWIMRVYMLLGDPFAEGRHLVAAAGALIGLMEELTWRGLVTPLLEERVGILKGNIGSTLLYAASHLPAMWALSDEVAGLNPLLPMAALGCGAAWSYLRWRMERLPPVLLSHALFTWMVVEFPLWT